MLLSKKPKRSHPSEKLVTLTIKERCRDHSLNIHNVVVLNVCLQIDEIRFKKILELIVCGKKEGANLQCGEYSFGNGVIKSCHDTTFVFAAGILRKDINTVMTSSQAVNAGS
ncbi:hypothetical protein J437_LFUL002895, partial [Ladona fulva]